MSGGLESSNVTYLCSSLSSAEFEAGLTPVKIGVSNLQLVLLIPYGNSESAKWKYIRNCFQNRFHYWKNPQGEILLMCRFIWIWQNTKTGSRSREILLVADSFGRKFVGRFVVEDDIRFRDLKKFESRSASPTKWKKYSEGSFGKKNSEKNTVQPAKFSSDQFRGLNIRGEIVNFKRASLKWPGLKVNIYFYQTQDLDGLNLTNWL